MNNNVQNASPIVDLPNGAYLNMSGQIVLPGETRTVKLKTKEEFRKVVNSGRYVTDEERAEQYTSN